MTCTCLVSHPSLTEEIVFNYAALPPSLYGWRCFRIEYGFECSCPEGLIYLPPNVDPSLIQAVFDNTKDGDATQRPMVETQAALAALDWLLSGEKWPKKYTDAEIEAIQTIRAALSTPSMEDELAMASEDHPHSYEKRVLDSIAHIRAEMAKGFYHPDKEPLEVIMYAAEEVLRLRGAFEMADRAINSCHEYSDENAKLRERIKELEGEVK